MRFPLQSSTKIEKKEKGKYIISAKIFQFYYIKYDKNHSIKIYQKDWLHNMNGIVQKYIFTYIQLQNNTDFM